MSISHTHLRRKTSSTTTDAGTPLPKLPGYHFPLLHDDGSSYRKSHLLTIEATSQLPRVSAVGAAPERRSAWVAFSSLTRNVLHGNHGLTNARSHEQWVREREREQRSLAQHHPEWNGSLQGKVLRFTGHRLLGPSKMHETLDTFPLVASYEKRRRHVLPLHATQPQEQSNCGASEVDDGMDAVLVYYFLEDGSSQVTAAGDEHAGNHASYRFLARTVVQEVYLEALAHGDTIPISLLGHQVRLSACDAFTHHVLTKLGYSPTFPIADFGMRLQSLTERDDTSQRNPHATGSDMDVTQQRWYRSAINRSLLENDKKVLRFHAVWMKGHPSTTLSVHDAPFPIFQLLYYIADGTVCIKEVQLNGGHEVVSNFFKRAPLLKLAEGESAASSHRLDTGAPSHSLVHYTHTDLYLGAIVSVLGRPFLLYDADPYTSAYIEHTLQQPIRQPASWSVPGDVVSHLRWFHHPDADGSVVIAGATQSKKGVASPPPHRGHIGSPEDTLGSCQRLVLKAPRKDFEKAIEYEKDVLRFRAVLWNPKPSDLGRVFVLCYYRADDTLAMYEQEVVNSGHTPGRYLARQRVPLDPSQSSDGDGIAPVYLSHRDLHVGSLVNIYGTQFYLEGIDERTEQFKAKRSAIQNAGRLEESAFEIGGAAVQQTAQRILQQLRVILRMKHTYARDTYRVYAVRYAGTLRGRQGELPLPEAKGLTLGAVRSMLDVHNLLEHVTPFERSAVTLAVMKLLDCDQDGFVGLADFEQSLMESDGRGSRELIPFHRSGGNAATAQQVEEGVSPTMSDETKYAVLGSTKHDEFSAHRENRSQQRRAMDATRRAVSRAFADIIDRKQYRVAEVFRFMAEYSSDARVGIKEFTNVVQNRLQMGLDPLRLQVLYSVFFCSNATEDSTSSSSDGVDTVRYDPEERITFAQFNKRLVQLSA